MTKTLLTYSDLADAFGYTEGSIRHMVNRGVISPVARGPRNAALFDPDQVAELADKIHGRGDWIHTEDAADATMTSVTVVVDAINAGDLVAEKVGSRWVIHSSQLMRWGADRDPDFITKWNERAYRLNTETALQKMRSASPERRAKASEALRAVDPEFAEWLDHVDHFNKRDETGWSPAMRHYAKQGGADE